MLDNDYSLLLYLLWSFSLDSLYSSTREQSFLNFQCINSTLSYMIIHFFFLQHSEPLDNDAFSFLLDEIRFNATWFPVDGICVSSPEHGKDNDFLWYTYIYTKAGVPRSNQVLQINKWHTWWKGALHAPQYLIKLKLSTFAAHGS